jgi:hypothetical protein
MNQGLYYGPVGASNIPVMWSGSRRHAELAGALIKWWEDLWRRGMTSRVVLVQCRRGGARVRSLTGPTEGKPTTS